jgi:hypothetical protein
MAFGSLNNLLMSNAKAPEPKVGMGATRLSWTDRDPYTIIEVRSPKRIVVQADDARRSDANGMSESQSYLFIPDPNGHKVVLTLRKNGKWVPEGEPLKGAGSFLIGSRGKYHDYSF